MLANFFKIFIFFILVITVSACNRNKSKNKYLFDVLKSEKTGLEFSNTLKSTNEFNMFKYMYFYNGAGIANGDFNNDGLIDVFFAGNQIGNKLYLNKGNLKFEEKTNEANITNDSAWNTGVSVVDINYDGLLDLYISRVGNFEKLQSKNQFLICKGIKNNIPFYENEAHEMGLDVSAFGSQVSFFDYDGDKDLDVYIMNHSLRFNGTFNDRDTYENKVDSLAADYFFENVNGKFKNVSQKAGITGTIISYGLGLCVSDINMDGWLDIYVGNDFHENDYLYMNQKNGTFKEMLQQQTMHTSQFSMGVDIADINNDLYPEIITMDMLPNDAYTLKRSLGDDEYNLFNYKVKAGYQPQFSRNTLQLNNKNGSFSDIAMYSGLEATDWSWAPLWLDFNNDGWKDLFVSNGIPKRLNDMDYISFVGDKLVQEKIRNNTIDEKDNTIINNFPEIKLNNKFFINNTNGKFGDIGGQIQNDQQTFSNGAVYADFDNDGDMDIIVNNINDKALLYENKLNTKAVNKFLKIYLKGDSLNRNALGAKIILYQDSSKQLLEKLNVRGFLSSMEIPLLFGLGNKKIDSLVIIWPDNKFETIKNINDSIINLGYNKNLKTYDYTFFENTNYLNKLNVNEITSEVNLNFLHEENNFNEFDRELLIPHMLSREGPGIAVGDINNDGLEDIFLGSSKFKKSEIFIQNKNGKYRQTLQIDLNNDSTYEDVDAQFIDINNDGFKDLVIASGGNEFYGNSEYLLPRVYLNNGKSVFIKNKSAFENNIQLTASCIRPFDFNKDGFLDLFIGARAVPFAYGKTPNSFLLLNDGKGNFINVTRKYSKEIETIGFVTDAYWADLNNDKQDELLITLEWGEIVAFELKNGIFEKKMITSDLGWWRCITPFDIDNDGDLDIVVGNLGENNRFHASIQQPVKMYYNDFDNNGTKEQILTYYLNNKEITFANKDEIVKQLPILKKNFLYASDFAKSSIKQIFDAKKLDASIKLSANNFSSTIFINNGNFNFSSKALPWQSQLSTCNNFTVAYLNNDSLPDLLVASNFYYSNIQMGKYDADYGTALINKGNGEFENYNLFNYLIKGQIKVIKPIMIKEKQAYIILKNNDKLQVININK